MYFIGSFIMLLVLSVVLLYKDEIIKKSKRITEDDFDIPYIWIMFLALIWPITLGAFLILGVVIFISEYKIDEKV